MDDRIHKLQEAALKGDVAVLLQLLKEDPLLLTRIDAISAIETPLHIASLQGHVDFAIQLLNQRPELARMRNEMGSYPIHLASAKGNVQIVKEMSMIDSGSLCDLRDKDGRSPLHVAAANGQVGVLKELIKVDASLARAVSDPRGEPALHLCLKYNQFEAAKLLVTRDEKLVKMKDVNGDTVLHIATARRQFQMLELFLKQTKVDVNATNGYELTALDVFMLIQSPSECGDREISDMLYNAGCKRSHKLRTQLPITHPTKAPSWKKRLMPNSWYQRQKKDKNWFKEKHNTLLIVATLIATVTFAAGITPPGSVWQDYKTKNPCRNASASAETGKAIQNDCDPTNFKKFMYFDMSGLVSSLFIILFLVSGLPLKNHVTTWILVMTMWVAVTSVTMAFVYGTRLVVVSDRIAQKLFWVLVSWSGLMGILLFWYFILFIFHLIHLLLKLTPVWLWVEKKYRERRRSGKASGDCRLLADEKDVENGQGSLSVKAG